VQHTTMGSHQAVPHSTTLLCHPTHAGRDSAHAVGGRLAGLPATPSASTRRSEPGTMLQLGRLVEAAQLVS